MNPDFRITLDIVQVFMLGGLIWGIARMSGSITTLTEVTTGLTGGLKDIAAAMSDVLGRVRVLEDRSKR